VITGPRTATIGKLPEESGRHRAMMMRELRPARATQQFSFRDCAETFDSRQGGTWRAGDGRLPVYRWAGGAVLARTTNSVATSKRLGCGVVPWDSSITMRVAAAPISVSGWRTVVSGGASH